MSARAVAILALLLGLPLAARANSTEGQPPPVPVLAQQFRDAQGNAGVLLAFPHTAPDRTRQPFTPEEIKALLALFEQRFGKQQPLPPPHYPTGRRVASAGHGHYGYSPPEWQQEIRKEYVTLYGEEVLQSSTRVEPPVDMEESRFFQALRLSVKYMPAGVREQAVELFNSPVFIVSLGISMTLYMVALAAPEPVLTKAFVGAATLGLAIFYGMTELSNVAMACKQLYDEAGAARNLEELEQAAKRFGERMGAVGLRILVTVAMGRLAGKLPSISKAPGGGETWTGVGTPRFALNRLVTVGGRPVVQTTGGTVSTVVDGAARAETLVANGTILLMGALVGAEASAVKQAIQTARTTGGCRPDRDNGNAEEHHIATNKNTKSSDNGGPWTQKFIELFDAAGIGLEHSANRVFVVGHQGPHPEEYHQAVFKRLSNVLASCGTREDCSAKFIDALDSLASDICKPTSRLNKLVTKKP